VVAHTHTHSAVIIQLDSNDNWSKYTKSSCSVYIFFVLDIFSLSCLLNFIALLIICRLAFDAVTSEIFFLIF
jgi:hypothetical protein